MRFRFLNEQPVNSSTSETAFLRAFNMSGLAENWRRLKGYALHLAYGSGALGVWHKFRNSKNLTVAMFHRVLPPQNKDLHSTANDYAISTDDFRACIEFFAKHYTVIDLDTLVGALSGNALPANPLLITFDDGWRDTLEYAAPLLLDAKMSATCFVIGDAISALEPRWWSSAIGAYLQTPGAASVIRKEWEMLGEEAPLAWSQHSGYLVSQLMFYALPDERRAALIARTTAQDKNAVREMLTTEELPRLIRAGVSIGAHGSTHLPLTAISDPEAELVRSRVRLEAAISLTPQKDVTAVSFPHGKFNHETLAACGASGFELMFSSSSTLTAVSKGRRIRPVLGRINVARKNFSKDKGTFSPERLAHHLFSRKVVA